MLVARMIAAINSSEISDATITQTEKTSATAAIAQSLRAPGSPSGRSRHSAIAL